MLSLRKNSLLITPEILQETAGNMTVLKWIQDGSEKWLQGLKDLIDGLIEVGEISISISSEVLARGILALRDGLYNSLSLGADVNKVRNTWVEIMGILMKQALN